MQLLLLVSAIMPSALDSFLESISSKALGRAEGFPEQGSDLLRQGGKSQSRTFHERVGVCGCRGRKERMEFAESFNPAYHFRLLYSSSAMMYPIRGALRHVYGGPWEVRTLTTCDICVLWVHLLQSSWTSFCMGWIPIGATAITRVDSSKVS